ncbi:PaaX family transcriptional regulator C-terminal domain-containing protein [Paeniglutamicibacter sp. NPDC091659]|uniref:PaaX family transcriptional regulator n=1 Tax=Paeniglutamicibacter sp. NPDC091659 TaxID=3364389 RepID=UPI003820164F
MENNFAKVQHQQLIVTIFGLYGTMAGGVLPVSVLVDMFAAMGVEAAAARSSVSRLKNNGTLVDRRAGKIARYALSDKVLDSFHEGDQRIYDPQRSAPGDPWSLVIFSVPESERNRRYELRTELTSLGFGSVGAGVAIAPSNVLEQARTRLSERGLAQYVEYFNADYLDAQEIREKVGQWWDLESLDLQYSEFLALYRDAEASWNNRLAAEREPVSAAGDVARQAFGCFVPMLTLWRRFPYRDPNLPLEYLPSGWKAPDAKQMFWAVERLLAPLAHAHAEALLESRNALVPTASIQASTPAQ